jgi:predicted protein tyrosine phosphatase
VEISLWNDKEAVGKTKGSSYLGSHNVQFTGSPISVEYKGVALVIRALKEPTLDSSFAPEEAYRYLLEKCLELDLAYEVGQNGDYTLSHASEALLYIFALRWDMSDATRLLLHVEYLLPKFANQVVPLRAFYDAFKVPADGEKAQSIVFTKQEKLRWIKLLVSMENLFRQQLLQYRERFSCNQPENCLDMVLSTLHYIYNCDLLRSERPDIGDWESQLLLIVQQGALARFQVLSTFSSNQLQNGSHGASDELLRSLRSELSSERMYFRKSFKPCVSQETSLPRNLFAYPSSCL